MLPNRPEWEAQESQRQADDDIVDPGGEASASGPPERVTRRGTEVNRQGTGVTSGVTRGGSRRGFSGDVRTGA